MGVRVQETPGNLPNPLNFITPCHVYFLIAKMAPITRSKAAKRARYNTTSHREHNTPQKTRFFNAYDGREPGQSQNSVAAQCGIAHSTASKWLHDRSKRGKEAYRRVRPLSKHLGKPFRIPLNKLRDLTVPSKNAVRNENLKVQIKHHKLPIKKRALQRNLHTRLRKAALYKAAYSKPISDANRAKRVTYALQHQEHSIGGFWHRVVFSDEAHVDPGSSKTPYILREQGTRYEPENLMERPDKIGNKIHMAAWCNWYQKAPELIFYHDEMDELPKPKKPQKPRKSKYESEEQYQQRIADWQLTMPHDVEVSPKGNSMTMKYYSEVILPQYISALHSLRIKFNIEPIFQQDNDSSHGTRGQAESIITKQLQEAQIELLLHPPNSPDLSPIEACWNILKNRIRQYRFSSIAQLKDALQTEWKKITITDVRKRIQEMPSRCKTLLKTGGDRIRSNVW